VTAKKHDDGPFRIGGHRGLGVEAKLSTLQHEPPVVRPYLFTDDLAQQNTIERHVAAEIVDGPETIMDRWPIVSGIEIGLESDVIATDEEARD
jgi:hypothetical protein